VGDACLSQGFFEGFQLVPVPPDALCQEQFSWNKTTHLKLLIQVCVIREAANSTITSLRSINSQVH
jgi:hypothetical protein